MREKKKKIDDGFHGFDATSMDIGEVTKIQNPFKSTDPNKEPKNLSP